MLGEAEDIDTAVVELWTQGLWCRLWTPEVMDAVGMKRSPILAHETPKEVNGNQR